ncbi:hypothetical protein HN51_013341 [Arachis hypogaea]
MKPDIWLEASEVAVATPTVGSHVWVEDSEVAWIDSEVLEVNEEEVKVSCTLRKTVVVKVSCIYHKDTEVPPGGVDDMTKLAYLHKSGVLENLRSRYDINEIYVHISYFDDVVWLEMWNIMLICPILCFQTYTGNILIAVNPFIKLPHLYDSHMMAQYKGAVFSELSPHPFAIADAVYR